MRPLATLGLVALALFAAARLDAQPASSPYTPEETGTIVRVWETIRGAARYEDIDWRAIGVAGEPGSAEARALMAQHWQTLRGAARFTDINWYSVGYGPPPPAAAATPAERGTRARAADEPAPAAAAGSLAGSWSGTWQSYPSFLRVTLDVPAGASANTAVQATLRLDGGIGAQGGPTGEAPVTLVFDPAARALTLTLGREVAALRLQPRTLHGFLDTRTETIAGVIENAPGDSSPYFVLARPGAAGERIFEPLEDAMGRPGAPGPLGTLRQLAGGTDLDDLQRWARKFVDEYPDLDPYRTESGQLFTMARNLFADAHFEAHFGTTFDAMSAGDRQRVTMGLRNAPAPQGTTPIDKTNGLLRAVERAFLPITGTYTAADMALSTIAIRHLTAWRSSTLAGLAAGGETLDAFRMAAAVDGAAARLAPYLWPSERTELAGAAATSLERAARAPLVAEVDTLLANAKGLEGARALDAALKLRPGTPRPALERAAGGGRRGAVTAAAAPPAAAGGGVSLAELAQWAPDTWAAQQPRLNAGLDALLTELLAAPRATLGLATGTATPAANPAERLARSKAWYDGNRELVEGFASRGVVAEFLNDLGAQREADFAAAMPALSQQLAAAATPAAAQNVGRELAVDLDLGRSRSWQAFERQRSERLQAIDRAAFVARVGDGPFGPDYPGAAYLNALYRNDTARLDAEDRAVAEPMARTMEQLYAGSGVDALASLFSGGALAPGDLTRMIAEETRRYTIARALTGFFIVAYERVYPSCMDADPVVFEETTVWETVVTNGFGTEIARYPSGSSTTTYNINQRHAPAFRKIGAGGSAEGIDFTTTLFGGFLPRELTDALREVSAALRGLRIAMTDNACNSAVVTTLERNMLARAMAR